MTRMILVSIFLLSFLSTIHVPPITPGSDLPTVPLDQLTDSNELDLELAQRYEPVFYLHPDEIYYPQPVEVVLGISRLRQSKRMWFDTTILNTVTLSDLYTTQSNDTFFLDQWFGDIGSSEYGNYSFHQHIFETTLSPKVGGMEPAVYAHITRNMKLGYITIQYWLFYFYNDWFNKHEGDWEMVEVILASEDHPTWVIYSQHHGGVRRSWDTAPVEGQTHPVVYVARGSHANYFSANEVYPYKQNFGNRQIVLVDRTGRSDRLLPEIVLIPSRSELESDPDRWTGAQWLMYRGRWGETAVYGDFNGPYGPADKGQQWDEPYVWGIDQPLDGETWYKNRLRIEVSSPQLAPAQIWLTDINGQVLPQADRIDNQVILHSEPPGLVEAQISGLPGTAEELNVLWPDRAKGTITWMHFSGFELNSVGRARLELSAGQALFYSADKPVALPSNIVDIKTPVWDAPDTVIAGNHLTITEILAGLTISLLISLVPILILVAILYWVDRYHKAPIRFLAIAFLWGAIPALLIALSLQLFFNPPPNILGASTLETIRLGLMAPVLEEVFKAIGVLIIYWRSRREINDVLDGVIYGAMVGFGFAFISNASRYAGSFFAYGYNGLELRLIAERTVNALDHGLYTAVFGAGLGFAILAKKRRFFWIWLILGLVLAIATHALHNILANSLVGLNLFTVIVTVAGTAVIWTVAGWSLVKQRHLLQKELQGLVHDSLYHSVIDPVGRAKAQWQALRRAGYRDWIQVRKLQRLCIKLANVQLQSRLFPEKYIESNEASVLQDEIRRIFDGLSPATQ